MMVHTLQTSSSVKAFPSLGAGTACAVRAERVRAMKAVLRVELNILI
jgi:hypothetical protein